MRAVIQRVSSAKVTTESGHQEEMGSGLVILLGIEEQDNEEDIAWLSGKIARLRIFDDKTGIMNLSVTESGGDCMVISQFTLHASTKKGNRPSWIKAARPETAEPLYRNFTGALQKETGRKVRTGVFGDHMDLSLVNDGPVTIIMDSKNKE